MRLFIAINFEDAVKEKLIDAQKELRKYAIKGNFTHEENLHLTLIFIGEVSGDIVDGIKKSMDAAADVSAFNLPLNGAGCFKRDRGDLWWVGVKPCGELLELQKGVAEKLYSVGIKFDDRPFSPHLTIAREVILDNSFDKAGFLRKAPSINAAVNKISLMKSERLAGKLVYTEIFATDLKTLNQMFRRTSK